MLRHVKATVAATEVEHGRCAGPNATRRSNDVAVTAGAGAGEANILRRMIDESGRSSIGTEVR
jgi:hypothetical protein